VKVKYLRIVVGLIAAALASGSALGQNTIGELLAAGGKQLTKDETKAMLSGATVTGPTATGGETQAEYKTSGSVSGYMTNPTGTRGGIVGTWTVDDTGQLCRDIELRFRESRQIKDCFPVFRLGEQIYFPATSSSEPSVAILKRTVTR
jgi:hypothetical protein